MPGLPIPGLTLPIHSAASLPKLLTAPITAPINALKHLFGIHGAADAPVPLSDAQGAWVQGALTALNMGHEAAPTIGAFQTWWNATYVGVGRPAKPLRTDGVLDEDTLCALQTVLPAGAPQFPDPTGQFCKSASLAQHPSPHSASLAARWDGLSTPAKVGVGVAAAAVVGGVAYAVVRHRGRR